MTDTEASRKRFLLDAMLGSLSTYLRMCGHDAACVLDITPDREVEEDRDTINIDTTPSPSSRGLTDDEILAHASSEKRTILTRDTELAQRADDVVLLTARDVEDQLHELATIGYDLTLRPRLSRCGACNGRIESLSSDVVVPEYAPDPSEKDCWQCLRCEQIFWKGSHWDDVEATLERVQSSYD
jgi:uncharacterized protein with PIN domain